MSPARSRVDTMARSHGSSVTKALLMRLNVWLVLRFGSRISKEGGADVPATWAAPRS